VDGRALAAAATIGLLTTLCCAWRWTIVAHGLGVRLSLPAAVAAYYRSLFLNLTLPGGSSATFTAASAMGATSTTSAVGCGRSHGSAPPGRLCRW